MEQNSSQKAEPTEQAAAPTLPTHSEDGVDLTLIRWFLSLTPAERLQALQNHMRAVMRIRDANPHLILKQASASEFFGHC